MLDEGEYTVPINRGGGSGTNHLSTLIIMAIATPGHGRLYNLVGIMQFEVFHVLHGSKLQFKYQRPWKICTYV